MCEDSCKSDVERGKKYALHLLSYGDRSKLEIEQKLRRKKYPEDVIARILRYLERMRFVDDRKFAREWTRIVMRKGIASKRAGYELRKKGIREEIVTEVFQELFSQVDEKEMARKLLYQKKYLPLSQELNKDEKLKQLAKIQRILFQRGFSNSTISDIIWENR